MSKQTRERCLYMNKIALVLLVLCVASQATERSRSARADFQRANPCPSTGERRGACPGYVVDHVKALACGGLDRPENMAWQTIADAKEKDKWERKECNR